MKLEREFAHPPRFTTHRLRIRPMKFTDAKAIFEFKSNEAVTKHYGQEPKSLEETRTWVRHRLAGPRRRGSIFWVFTLKRDDTAIGSFCFWNFDPSFRTAEIGYELHPAHWGKGLMAEAIPPILDYGFSRLGLHRVGHARWRTTSRPRDSCSASVSSTKETCVSASSSGAATWINCTTVCSKKTNRTLPRKT